MDAISAGRQVQKPLEARGHRLWVRLTHWAIAGAALVLIGSGGTILMAHPRLYWGHAGNDLTRPLVEVPLGPNHSRGAWSKTTPFFTARNSPVTANRLTEPWNQNSWARSLHFLAAWVFITGLLTYLAFGIGTGHVRRNLLPRRAELSPSNIGQDIKAHLRQPMPAAEPGPPYAILQKLTYLLTALVLLPVMFLTGISMSPAIAAEYPVLLDVFGGTQSARTIHFFAFVAVTLFLAIHLVMILLTRPLRQVRGMTVGNQR